MDEDKIRRMIEKFNNPAKVFYRRVVEKDVLSLIESYNPKNKLRGLTLCGPNYEHHVNTLFENILDEIHIVEKSRYVFKIIFDKTSTCDYYNGNKVSVYHSDIENMLLPNMSYVELDFLQTLPKTDWAITKHLKHQAKIQYGIKIFRFSGSIRGDGGSKNRFKIIKRIIKNALNAHISGLGAQENFGKGENLAPTQRRKYAKQYIPTYYKNRTGRILDMRAYVYNDSGGIFTCVIIYK